MLKQLRKSRGYESQYVAKQIGVSVPSMSKIEKTDKVNKVETLQRLCNFYGIECNINGKGEISWMLL